MVSWVHVRDVARAFRFAIERIELSGAYNIVAPLPVTHSNLVHSMARAKGGLKIPFPVPSFVLKMVLGEMSVEILKSCTVSADKIMQNGYRHQYDTIEKAVKEILSP